MAAVARRGYGFSAKGGRRSAFFGSGCQVSRVPLPHGACCLTIKAAPIGQLVSHGNIIPTATGLISLNSNQKATRPGKGSHQQGPPDFSGRLPSPNRIEPQAYDLPKVHSVPNAAMLSSVAETYRGDAT
jgi:hypothetical protein